VQCGGELPALRPDGFTLEDGARGTHFIRDGLDALLCRSNPLRCCAVTCVIYCTIKNAVFWDVMPCCSCKNRRFGETGIGEIVTTLAVSSN
jgi:hypothetical protein